MQYSLVFQQVDTRTTFWESPTTPRWAQACQILHFQLTLSPEFWANTGILNVIVDFPKHTAENMTDNAPYARGSWSGLQMEIICAAISHVKQKHTVLRSWVVTAIGSVYVIGWALPARVILTAEWDNHQSRYLAIPKAFTVSASMHNGRSRWHCLEKSLIYFIHSARMS